MSLFAIIILILIIVLVVFAIYPYPNRPALSPWGAVLLVLLITLFLQAIGKL